MQCPRCQQDNPIGQNFCGECGNPLQHSSVDRTPDRTPSSSLLTAVPPIEPIEQLSPDVDEDEALESAPGVEGQRSGTLIPKLVGVLSGVTLAALVLSLLGPLIGRSLASRPFTGSQSSGPSQPSGQTNETFTPAQLPALGENPEIVETRPAHPGTPAPARAQSEASSVDGPTRTKSTSSRAVERRTLRERERRPSTEVTGAASQQPGTPSKGASISPEQTSTPVYGAPPNDGTAHGASGDGSRLSATVRPSANPLAPSNPVASAPPPEAATPKATPRFGGSYAELVGEPISRGWGYSYALRLVDSSGQPLVAADVLLVAHMADGTVENIAMGSLPEPGTYRATVPAGLSTPVDLRVRVNTGEKFVEVPLRR